MNWKKLSKINYWVHQIRFFSVYQLFNTSVLGKNDRGKFCCFNHQFAKILSMTSLSKNAVSFKIRSKNIQNLFYNFLLLVLLVLETIAVNQNGVSPIFWLKLILVRQNRSILVIKPKRKQLKKTHHNWTVHPPSHHNLR